MADEKKSNPIENTMELDTAPTKDDTAAEKGKALDTTPVSDDADGETKAFSTVSGGLDNEKTPEDVTRQFTIDGGGKKSQEKCEERGSVKNYNLWSVAWRVLRPLLILVISAALVYFLGAWAYHYIEDSYFAPVDAQSQEIKSVDIKTGSSLSRIATTLFEEGIIRNKFVFQMYVDVNDMGSSLLAGEYEFSPNMTMEEIVNILGEGDGGREIVEITIIEGMTVEDMADELVEEGIFDAFQKLEFLKLCNDLDTFKDNRYVEMLINSESEFEGRTYMLEGYLFPDTYEFYEDETPENIILRMLSRFDDIFKLTYEDRAEDLGMTVDEIVTLASIIEWEGLPKDYKKVSAVFHNRLEEEMEFGSCATLRYVTGEKKLEYTAEERAIDSPYNTYMYAGLPIGSVTNPGKEAIEAALYPYEEYIEEGYLYFRNASPDSGDLAFAKTLEEHNENGRIYDELVAAQSANGE